MAVDPTQLLTVGRVSGVYGVRGWVRVHSYTAPRTAILEYGEWHLLLQGRWQPVELSGGRAHGKGIVVQFEAMDDRDRARELIGVEIAIPRSQLPPPEPGEYYWTDLEGLQVETLSGEPLGQVAYLLETGANDVMVVRDGERERLIPFVLEQYVKQVDLEGGCIRVDWDPDF